MKLIRFGSPGAEKPGVLVDGQGRLDVSAFGEDYDEAFFGSDGPARLLDWLQREAGSCPRVADVERLGAPICRPSKIICVGLNYRGHAAETNAQLPSEPILFMKASSALVGPQDDLVLPRGSTKTDWEVELAFVVGKRARYVPRARALDHIAGYALHNDYSEREHQLERGGQWVKGKSADTFAPLGPFLATADELDPGGIKLWLRVNGELKQDSTTADLIFDVPTLLSYISEFMTLLPGDVVSTGTPAGVALGKTPPPYLRAGDVVELGGDGLGTSRQRVVTSTS
ncbi:MAG TPA: fumarylacetoacetate hydrolase family protein [Polyangiaceae bacterium]|nr:fumarylacetoacetate hydrolase family protein [Polyangiaceae bacterium]